MSHWRRVPACLGALLLWLFALSGPAAAQGGVTRHVDPFIGTQGTGHVFPGAVVPFGMVAPSPDSADRGWSFSGGYQFDAPRILGFSNTHISGAGIPELGDVLLMPVQGEPWGPLTTDFSAAPDKTRERAAPGFYQVALPAHDVTVSLTATQRVAVQRYRFARGGRVQVLVDLQHGLHFTDAPRVVSSTARSDPARGELSGTVFARNWVERQASFLVRFDRPALSVQELPRRPGEQASRFLFVFDLGTGRDLEARVALSTVDEAGARGNLEQAARRSFDTIRRDADRQWEELLGRVTLTGTPRDLRIFYTALYHAMIHPSDIADWDGRVRGPAGQVIDAPRGTYYSTLSLWDTFRGVHPLLTLLAPERVGGFVETLLAHHDEAGMLPLWTVWGRETWTMIGNPAMPVISDAMSKNLGDFDHRRALAALVSNARQERPFAPAWAQRTWADYIRLGYVPFDRVPGESVSKSLEYGIGDAAVASAAQTVGSTPVYLEFARRAQGYRLLFDPETGTMRGRDSTGAWRSPFDPLSVTSPLRNPGDYTEANAWQYTPTPGLHDPLGLQELLGGPAGMGDWLDAFFALPPASEDRHLGQEALIGQYAHGNEPSHHIAWLYAWTDRPERGRALVRRIARDFYTDRPDGIIGNDDAGQMSAWYVLATLGLYPVQPGEGLWTIGEPLAGRVTLQVPGGASLVITREAPGPAARPRILVDGHPIAGHELTHGALIGARTVSVRADP